MNHPQSAHQFADASQFQLIGLRSHDCQLTIEQQPLVCKVNVGKEKDRKAVDPPPIVQLRIGSHIDPQQTYLHSTSFFLSCSVEDEQKRGTSILNGTLVSSLHRLKGTDGDGAFFVFGDISVKVEGLFRLRFDLYELRNEECWHRGQIISEPFSVQSAKVFAGTTESTWLTRNFSEQGCKLRLRKEPRSMIKPRPATDYQKRPYGKGRASQVEVSSPIISQEISQKDQGSKPPRQDSGSYSQHSQPSYSGSVHFDEPLPKRPRTDSEQSQIQAFGHQSFSMDNSQYETEIYQDSQLPTYAPLQQPTQSYGYPYVQSPQEVPRDQYFGQGARNQVRSTSYSGPSSQYIIPDYSQQPVRSSHQPAYQMHPPIRSATDFNSASFIARSTAQDMNMPAMSSMHGMDSDWVQNSLYQPPIGTSSSHESGYDAYAGQSSNMTPGSIIGYPPMSSGPPTGPQGGF